MVSSRSGSSSMRSATSRISLAMSATSAAAPRSRASSSLNGARPARAATAVPMASRAPLSSARPAWATAAGGVGTRPALGRHHAGQHDLVGADDETPLDPGLGGPVADHGGVGGGAEEQPDGLDEHRLAGARLAGERRHPRPEHEVDLGDDAEVADAELGQHQRSARPNLDLRI